VGSEVGLFYDPMLAKLIVHAEDRNAAISRMHRALLELNIEGVETSREFHLRMMEDAEFRSGDITIQWLESRLPAITALRPPADAIRAAVIAAALLAERHRHALSPQREAAAAMSTTDVWQRTARLESVHRA
jgi:acetyl/propionyl-CoA carboxylase alpha subunit